MLFRSIIVLGVALVSLSVFTLFQVKHKVQNLKKDLLEVNRQIAIDSQEIHVLKAEWAYLSQPTRIKELSDRYLGLKYITAAQVRREYEEIPSNFAQKDDGKNGGKEAVIGKNPVLKPILSSVKTYR